ncbi:MAG TPA: efflux RND transporter periplasmic adaptor subunit [Methylomirabilota bacterium]|nr:efflux RND transporter periplasmic adaptor subunit [Methylomirabilota bacterium]
MTTQIPHRHLMIAAFGVALLALTPGCKRATSETAPPPPTVGVAEVVARSVPIVREYIGRTEAVPTVELRARVPGVLEQVLVDEGRGVTRGQTLFVIQREEYAAALDSARAQLAKTQADLTRALDTSVVDRARAQLEQRKADRVKSLQDVNRYRPLAEARAIPRENLDTAVALDKVAVAAVDEAAAALKDTELVQRTQVQLAEAALQAARAALVQAQLNLGYTTVQSPIDGIVGRVQVDRGNLVGKSEPTLLATVSAVNPIYVDFPIAEADYLRLAPRIRLEHVSRVPDPRPWFDLLLADGTTFPHQGRATFVERSVDLKTGTITVRAAFPNPDRILRPGQFGRVRGVIETRANAVLVPHRAVQEQQGTRAVLVVDAAGKVALKPVKLDERVDDSYVVTEGLTPGERVIVDGVQKVRPGMQVKAELKPAAPPAAKVGG